MVILTDSLVYKYEPGKATVKKYSAQNNGAEAFREDHILNSSGYQNAAIKFARGMRRAVLCMLPPKL